jgi:hypothetical protein
MGLPAKNWSRWTKPVNTLSAGALARNERELGTRVSGVLFCFTHAACVPKEKCSTPEACVPNWSCGPNAGFHMG